MEKRTACPLCGQSIPTKKMKEYEKKFAERIEKEANKKLQSQLQENETKHREEIEELTLDLEEKLRNKYRKEYGDHYSKRLADKNKQIDKLLLQIDDLQRTSQRKTPNELGDEGQEDLLLYLREEFPNDEITMTRKGKEGADIFLMLLTTMPTNEQGKLDRTKSISFFTSQINSFETLKT